jgi:hypothetical protein
VRKIRHLVELVGVILYSIYGVLCHVLSSVDGGS